MKKLILLLLICSTIVSCTAVDRAETYVSCPCKVEQIKKYTDGYYIHARSIEDEYEYIAFYTTTSHQLGDTIQ